MVLYLLFKIEFMLLKKLLKNFTYKKQLLKIYDFIFNFIYRIKTKGIYDKKEVEIIKEHEKNIFLKINQIAERDPIKAEKFNLKLIINPSKIYQFKINKFVGFEGNHFLSGKDPLVETARQLLDNPNIKTDDTYLYKYFKDFKPKSIGAFYNLNESNKLYTVRSTKEFHPWSDSFPKGFRAGFFGPKDESSVRFRTLRLRNLLENISKFGYMPSKEDIIEGYILKKKEDYRFLVTAGHHRVSVMSLMHLIDDNIFEYLTARIKSFPPSELLIFDEEDVENWPAVKNKFLSVKDSLEMFNKFF